MPEQRITFCRLCEAFCGLAASVEGERIVEVRPDREHPVTAGFACPKAIRFHEVVHHPERILHPMKRSGSRWERVSWEAALSEIGQRLRTIWQAHGPHSIGIYVGNPTVLSFLHHRLRALIWRGALGTRNQFGAGSQDNLALFLSSQLLFGSFILPPIPDFERIRYLLLIGTNPVVSQGTLVGAGDMKRRLRRIRNRGGKIVVLDPRRTETARLADKYHFIPPDTDVFLLLAMLRLICRNESYDQRFLKHTTGVERIQDLVKPFTVSLTAEKTGMPESAIERLARDFSEAEGACARGRPTCGQFGTLTCWALQTLNVVTGNLDTTGGALLSPGLVAFWDVIEKSGARSWGRYSSPVGNHPEILGELPAGILADEILAPGEGQIRAMVISSGNPVLSVPDGPRLAEALQTLACTVALDLFMNATTSLVDYFLPCTTFMEHSDYPIFHSQMMAEPYAQWTDAVIPELGESKTEWKIFVLLTQAMGLEQYSSLLDVYARQIAGARGNDTRDALLDGFIRGSAVVAGISEEIREADWDLDAVRAHPHGFRVGEPRPGVLAERIRTPDAKIHLWSQVIENEVERLVDWQAKAFSGRAPRLVGRRDHRSMNSWLNGVPKLRKGAHRTSLRINPKDAARIGAVDGQRARVVSDVGEVEASLLVTEEMMPGVVSLPHGWAKEMGGSANVNDIVSERVIEPFSGMAFLNGVPVDVAPL